MLLGLKQTEKPIKEHVSRKLKMTIDISVTFLKIVVDSQTGNLKRIYTREKC